MLCSNCGKNQASVYCKQNINGNVTENVLCAECAEKMNIGKSLFDAHFSLNPFAGFFAAARGSGAKPPDAQKRCPLCGSEFQDIVKSGKIGCAKCYEVFAAELSPTIARLHGSSPHSGRAPRGHKIKNERRNKLLELKTAMGRAVEEQDFETAARLRDEIKALEAESNERSV